MVLKLPLVAIAGALITIMSGCELIGNPNLVVPPVAPTGLNIRVDDQRVQIQWNRIANAEEYQIYRSIGDEESFQVIEAEYVDNLYVDTDLTNGALYRYAISASNSGGVGAQTESVQAIPIARPENLMSTLASGQVTLEWFPVLDASGYIVYRGNAPDNLAALPNSRLDQANVSYIDRGLTNDTTYHYAVAAINSIGVTGGLSMSLDATPTVFQSAPGAAPGGLRVSLSGGSGQVMLQWDQIEAATGFEIYRGIGADGALVRIPLEDREDIPLVRILLEDSGTNLNYVAGLNYVDEDLDNGQLYRYVVAGVNNQGAGTMSEAIEAQPIDIPSALTATAGDGSISITWQPVDGASHYQIYRQTGDDGTSIALISSATPLASTDYMDTNVVNGRTYHYAIAGVNDTGEGARGDMATTAPLAVPSGLTATASDGRIALNWTAAAGANSYNIYIGTGLNGELTLLTVPGQITATSYSHTGIDNNVTRRYAVASVNEYGESSRSNVAVAIRRPADVSANPADSRVIVAWQSVQGATGYHIYRGRSIGNVNQRLTDGAPISGGDTSYIDVDLTNGTQYYYVVSAINDDGESARSAIVSATPEPSRTAPIAPTGVVLTPGDTQIEISWGIVNDASGYNIYRAVGETGAFPTEPLNAMQINTVPTSRNPYTDSGLINGETYRYIIIAVNDIGGSPQSEIATAIPFGAPSGLTAMASDGQIMLNWTAATGATGYNIYSGTGLNGELTLLEVPDQITETSYLHIGIDNDTIYRYAVASVNEDVDGARSNEVVVISRPSRVSATHIGSQIVIEWQAIPRIRYHIYRGLSANDLDQRLTGEHPTVDLSYRDADITNGVTYYYAVSAVNDDGESVRSVTVSVTPMEPAPTSPTTVIVITGDGQVTIRWNPVNRADSYNIYRVMGTTDPFSEIPHNPNPIIGESYTDSGLTNGDTYRYAISSVNGSGESDLSAAISGIPIGTPGAPNTVVGNSMITLTWTEVISAIGYYVYRSQSVANLGSFAPIAIINSDAPDDRVFIDMSVTSGSTYYYAVAAMNALGGRGLLSDHSQIMFSAPPAEL